MEGEGEKKSALWPRSSGNEEIRNCANLSSPGEEVEEAEVGERRRPTKRRNVTRVIKRQNTLI